MLDILAYAFQREGRREKLFLRHLLLILAIYPKLANLHLSALVREAAVKRSHHPNRKCGSGIQGVKAFLCRFLPIAC